jgi:carboxylate-amine ligase
MIELNYNKSPNPTIGVELELQILCSRTLALSSRASEILSAVEPLYQAKIKQEFLQSMVEITTGICKNVAEVEADLSETYRHLEKLAEKFNTFIYAASLHPFSTGDDQMLTDHPRYRRIMDELQLVGIRFITQGLHVHIGVDSEEKAIQTANTMRVFLPLLLALTTSSPFYEGRDTGLYSYRTKLFEALPLAGMPDDLQGWQGYIDLVERLIHGGIIESFRDLWWDVRPHPDFGTVEIRVCDIPSSMRDILALTAMIQALVVSLSEKKGHILPHIQILRANKWQAARHGLEGVFVDPLHFERMSVTEAVLELYRFVEPAARELGSLSYLEGIKEILQKKTSAHLQKQLVAEGKCLQEVVQIVNREFWL